MVDIAPLWPLRYDAALLDHVVAPPYDVVDPKLRQDLGRQHPHNVVHIDLPEGEGNKKYERAQGLFSEWQELGVVVRDEGPAYWRYAQTFVPLNARTPVTRRGFLALVRAVPFSDRVVLPHEKAWSGPKLDRIQLSRATRAVLSPQFMLYSDPARGLDAVLDSGEPFAEFETSDGIYHQIWRISAPSSIAEITAALLGRQLLLADGHHRYESAVAISAEFEAEALERGLSTSPRSEHRFTLAFLANDADPGLMLLPTHRLVHSLVRFEWNQFVTQARILFDVMPVEGGVSDLTTVLGRQTRPALCAVAQGGKAVVLVLRRDADLTGHPVLGKRPAILRDVDVVLLHDGLLKYVLEIGSEEQADKAHIKYLRDAAEGLALLEGGEGQVLFLMNAPAVSTIRRVAEAGEVMPAQSTYFYPKVPSGLCFHTLYPDRLVPP